jgi:thymidylate synthase (FAD)
MQTELKVKRIGVPKLDDHFLISLLESEEFEGIELDFTDAQVIALSAIRTCYSEKKPSEIARLEGVKYFGTPSKEDPTVSDATRLFLQIVRSGHTSTLEHLKFVFSVEGLSRAALAQLTRHRHMSYSVQSQRYVKFGSDDRSGGFDYIIPEKVAINKMALPMFLAYMDAIQKMYDELRSAGIPAEDARSVLPQASACNLTMSANLRSLIDFYSKRKKGRGAQGEIANLAETLRALVVEAEPWTDKFFEEA